MRAPLVPLVLAPLVAVALAGCLDEGGPPAGPAVRNEFRSLEAGQQSGLEGPLRRVVEDQDAWGPLWEQHVSNEVGNASRAAPPTVNFSEERVAAVVLEDRPNGCWAVRVANATGDDATLRLEVSVYAPPPDVFCPQVVTRPYHFVAVPADGRQVEFEERTVVGAPPDEAS